MRTGGVPSPYAWSPAVFAPIPAGEDRDEDDDSWLVAHGRGRWRAEP